MAALDLGESDFPSEERGRDFEFGELRGNVGGAALDGRGGDHDGDGHDGDGRGHDVDGQGVVELVRAAWLHRDRRQDEGGTLTTTKQFYPLA